MEVREKEDGSKYEKRTRATMKAGCGAAMTRADGRANGSDSESR